MPHDIGDHFIEGEVHHKKGVLRHVMPLAELTHHFTHELGLAEFHMKLGTEASGPH
jgi:hypothetical protein